MVVVMIIVVDRERFSNKGGNLTLFSLSLSLFLLGGFARLTWLRNAREKETKRGEVRKRENQIEKQRKNDGRNLCKCEKKKERERVRY